MLNTLSIQRKFITTDSYDNHDGTISAGHDLTLTTTAEHGSEFHQTEEKHSGLSGSGGIGLTYGSQSQKVTDSAQTLTQHGSTAGATQGDVILHAGDVLTVNGSELIAGHDMVLSGQSVALTAATEHSQQTHTVEQRTSGLTLALSGSAGTALSNTVQSVNQAKGRDNDRLQALYAVKGGLSAIQASQAVRLDEAQGAAAENDNTIGISLSYGSQSSKSTQQQTQYSAATSSLTAGHDLTVIASGKDGKGNILAEGSQLQAAHDITLDAQHDITLLSAQNASSLTGSNHSSGGNLGIGIGVGSGGWGIHISAGVNAGKGSEHGNGTTHDETIIGAGHQLSLHSGNDTTLQGAQLSGDRLLADIGHNLTISSEQDSDHYHSQQQNISASGSFTWGSMSGSGSISASRDKMNSDFLSVNEQSGLFAGNGGYDITVGSHTQLNGAVIASTTDKNRLDTGTLGWGSLHNSAEYDVEHSSAGMSSGGSIGSQFTGNMASSLLNGLSDHGKADGTTQSAVSNGSIIIRDKENQRQDIAAISHDTEKANGSIRPIFDKEKEQDKIEQAQVIGDIGNQLADIGRVEGNIRATQAGKLELAGKGIYEPEPGASAEDRERYNTLLANTEGYKAEQQKWGTGGSYQRAIQATTAALQGLNGGSVTAAIAGAAAPYIAEIIGHHAGIDNNDEAKVAAHAVANAVLASLQGQSALAGAAGAATGELTGILAMQMYGKPVSELSETDKQTISAMATLAAGIAGGIAGDSTAAAVVGAQAGKTTVENNNLGLIARGCAIAAPCRTKVAEQLLEIGAKAGIAGLAGVAVKDIADKMTSEELDHLITLEMVGNDEITRNYLNSLQDKYAPSHTGNNDIQINTGPNHTGGNQTATGNAPNHTGNDQAPVPGVTNTGNTDSVPVSGGTTTVTPAPDGHNKDDFIYLSEGDRPANMAPEGSARAGAFKEAKRKSGIPASQSPSKVYPNVDKRGNPQPGYIYEFDIPKSGGGTQKVYIRDDASGHFFGEGNSQNRGPHFNDAKGNHYDY
ncbi:hemagglutinin repeat-containing protein [Enterobacteriaceae bacterium ESL0689]|nr:hemagglutinin repeat-containing protein [Enterobacteriaceae bacterium ESL0689]